MTIRDILNFLKKGKKEEKLDCGGRDFDHCKFDECADDELYLVYLRKDNMEKAITPPSLAWLDCPLTYSA